MSKNAIELKNLTKRFKKGRKLLLKEALLDIFKPGAGEYFKALDNMNLEIEKGETVGIIGPNGSGKSTILKIISGIMVADEGEAIIKGRVAPLIELGAGFHPELTGRENVYINGVILGLTRKQIEKRFDEIVRFAELEDFIDTPVKHYSSGMYMRLGFAIAVNVDPDILLVDEVLAVGDTRFQQKCMKRMREFKKKGVTIIYVSHSLGTLADFCDSAAYLENGILRYFGEVDEAVELYREKVGG